MSDWSIDFQPAMELPSIRNAWIRGSGASASAVPFGRSGGNPRGSKPGKPASVVELAKDQYVTVVGTGYLQPARAGAGGEDQTVEAACLPGPVGAAQLQGHAVAVPIRPLRNGARQELDPVVRVVVLGP